MLIRRQSGQSSVELIVLAPVMALLLAAAVQVALAAHTRWSASAAARAAARASALGADPLPAARRALPALLESGVAVEETARGVRVQLAVPGVLPGLELGPLTAHATFASQR